MTIEELERRVKQLEEELTKERTCNKSFVLELTSRYNDTISQLTEQHKDAISQLTDKHYLAMQEERTAKQEAINELTDKHNHAKQEAINELTDKHNHAKQEAINQLTDRLTGEHREEIREMLSNMKMDIAGRLVQLSDSNRHQADQITRALQNEKSILGTTEPNQHLSHWFMLTSHGNDKERKIRCTSGQRYYIDRQHNALVENGDYEHHLTRQTGNGIDLRQYVKLNADPVIQNMIIQEQEMPKAS